mmetsp:Transcript_47100/g.74359  ORF Transcript_47100/g.74359 Transcript_47100/m.74359 type:complete len:865 (+) Transcript_47100:160-2754(+)
MRAGEGRVGASGSPFPPLQPLPRAVPPVSGLPPPRPPGFHIPREGIERSRAVRFDANVRKLRSRSSDDALLHGLGHLGGQDDDGKPIHNIHVAVRCRGLLTQEHKDGGHAILNVHGKVVILEDPHTTAADDYLRINKSKERRYAFDEAFGEDSSQQQVYERTTRVLIGSVLDGFNATVFAYGATSAGKTYTMLGSPTEPGIMMRTLHDLFSEVAEQRLDNVFEVKCSFLEVYNENIRDLLRPDGDYLDIREDPVKGMCVAGISEVGGLESANEIMTLLHQANRHRTTESTCANVTSSRSHAVLQVIVEKRDRTAAIVAQVNVGKLSMIDLAGSERASQTQNKGMRLIEGANINRSLLALGNCITALSSGVAFVPYRDSKMTRLLKDSLGGNCRTVMIANVSPCHLNYEDTHNTLKYANRAKNIKTKAMKNVVSVNYHLSKYTEIIKELKGEIAELKTKLSEDIPGVATIDLDLDCLSARRSDLADEEGNTAEDMEAAREQSTKWKQELMANFEERVRIKRQLIDLAHVAQNQMVLKSRAQVGISQWESSQVQTHTSKDHAATSPHSDFGDGTCSGSSADAVHTASEMPQSIRDLQEQLQFIRTEMANTEETTRDLEQQLVENLKVSERLQMELPTRVPNKDMRAFLGLVYRIYVLEVENIDLQEMNDVTQPLLQQKELEAEALRLQIRMRDKMIEEQDRLLALEQEEIPPKPAGWEAIPAAPLRRPLSSTEDEDDSPQKGIAYNADSGSARMGRYRARSAGPERLGNNGFVLPPLSPYGQQSEARNRTVAGGASSRRGRKNRRERDAATRAARRERMQREQASGIQRANHRIDTRNDSARHDSKYGSVGERDEAASQGSSSERP